MLWHPAGDGKVRGELGTAAGSSAGTHEESEAAKEGGHQGDQVAVLTAPRGVERAPVVQNLGLHRAHDDACALVFRWVQEAQDCVPWHMRGSGGCN